MIPPLGRAGYTLRRSFKNQCFHTTSLPSLPKKVHASALARIPFQSLNLRNPKGQTLSIPSLSTPTVYKTREAGRRFFSSTRKIEARPVNFFASASVAKQLPLVKNLRTTLARDKSAIVTGAPNTGKSEQIMIATRGDLESFGLRDEFLEWWCQKNEIPQGKERNPVWSEAYHTLKGQETDWLNENLEKLFEKLMASPKKTILLDEFDLASNKTLSSHETKTAKLIFQLGERLKNEGGKRVVYVMHSTALNAKALQKQTLAHEIHSTGFLDREAESALLVEMGIDQPLEIKVLLDCNLGQPAPYVGHLKQVGAAMSSGKQQPLLKTSFVEILQESSNRVERNHHVLERALDPKALKILNELAEGDLPTTHAKVKPYYGLFQEWGLGKIEEDGSLLIPPVILNPIRDQLHHIEAELIADLESLEEALKGQPKAIQESSRYSFGISGSIFKIKHNDRPLFRPRSDFCISEIANLTKRKICTSLGTVAYPTERSTNEHHEWENSVSTLDELLRLAKKNAGPFSEMVQGSCNKGTHAYMGENNEFVTKSKESAQRKIDGWAEYSGDKGGALRQLNDSLRATVIADDLGSMKNSILRLREEATRRGWEVVFSDKHAENYTSGYVGVHCKLKMIDGKNTILGEIQFHFRPVHDGSIDSLKETAHELYEIARADPSKKTRQRVDAAMRKMFAYGIEQVKITEESSG